MQLNELSFIARITTHSAARSWPHPYHGHNLPIEVLAKRPYMHMDVYIRFIWWWTSSTPNVARLSTAEWTEPRILPRYDKKNTPSILYFLKFTLYFFIRQRTRLPP